MKSFINIWMPVLALFVFSTCQAQIHNAKTETIKVYGNCGMCEKTIEKAAYKKGEAKVDWDKDTKMAQITYDATKTSTDDVLKRIAAAGYDSDKFTAPEEAYNNLPGCCQYDRPVKPAEPSGTATAPTTDKPSPEMTVVATPSVTAPANAMESMVKKQAAASAVAQGPLTEVYHAYFALKDALIATDGAAAATAAKSLFTAIDEVKMDALPSDQHTVWMKYEQKLSADADHIKSLTDTDRQRAYFASLSRNMYEVMKVIKPDGPVYLDHCPMYNEGKGADWLSLEKGIKNPYYGKAMLTCGKVTETLN